jgi:hypothetical protein
MQPGYGFCSFTNGVKSQAAAMPYAPTSRAQVPTILNGGLPWTPPRGRPKYC